MQISAEKNNLMTNTPNGIRSEITMNNEKHESVHSSKYLGATVSDGGSKLEILSRIAQSTTTLKLRAIWKVKNISISSKIRLMHSLIMSIFLYTCEAWTLTAETEKRVQAMEMRCLRKCVGISFKDHITNEEVKNKIKNAIWPYIDLLTTVQRYKLHGHVTFSNGFFQGTFLQLQLEEEERRDGRIREWGLPIRDAVRRAKDREGWRKLVAMTLCGAPTVNQTTG